MTWCMMYLRFNIIDTILYHTFVLMFSWLSKNTMKIKLKNKLFDRVCFRRISIFKFSIVKYIDHVATSSWCWVKIILFVIINSEIIVTSSDNLLLNFLLSIDRVHFIINSYVVVDILTNWSINKIWSKRWMFD
jgi:hypothetical protein